VFSFTSNSAPEPFLQKSTDLICDSLGEHLQTEAILTLCCSLLELRPQPFHIKKGERAIALCMPVTYRRKSTEGDEETETTTYQRFMIKNNWFVLSQTEGNEYTPEPIPEWNEMTALEALNISKVTFDSIDGNAQGYAAPGRKISISPMAAHPYKTLFHEVGHILLGHLEATAFRDGEEVEPNILEVEAECVAMLCCASLGLPGLEYSRGYIQSWAQGQPISDRSAQRIFAASDKILKAGLTHTDLPL